MLSEIPPIGSPYKEASALEKWRPMLPFGIQLVVYES